MVDTIVLRGKTRHGKNRINQHGEVWEVVDDNGKFKGQPAFSLKSLNKTEGPRGKKGHDSRWVLKKNDPDFEIVDELSDEELNMRLALMEQAEINAGRF